MVMVALQVPFLPHKNNLYNFISVLSLALILTFKDLIICFPKEYAILQLFLR